MIIPIELSFKADKDTRLAFSTNKTIKSHDVNSVEFHITIEGLELTDNHTAKILSIFHSSKSQVNMDCEIVDGKIIYKPDTKLISMYEDVTNYVYVYYNNQSVDVCAFKYTVDLSKIDETALKVKEMYDQSYADLLANFEQALSEYKDSLPQADSVRAEIDVILNQFGVDSQAKLSQYDKDAQQAIADNQTAFDLAESVRNEAEESRVQAEAQRASAESSRISAESIRASAESERIQAEVERKANEESRELAEDERKNAEEQRKIDHANRSAELAGKADKVVIENLITNGNFSNGTSGWVSNTATIREVINGELFAEQVNTNTNTVTIGKTSTIPFKKGHKYFVHIKHRQENPFGENRFKIRFSGGLLVGSSDHYFDETNTIIIESKSDDPSTAQYFSYSFGTYGDYSGHKMYLSDYMIINLTETFGAGNEPSKAEMDELIKITGYFDEIALTNKQLLTWQLNLMRQNRNALIALGGTII